MRKTFIAACLLLLATTFSSAAQAYDGFTRTALKLRAGPQMNYPVVLVLDRHVPVFINGCTPDWLWCEINSEGIHGWVSARHLNVYYKRSPIRVVDVGPRAYVPTIDYDRRAYWDRYYRDRDFYHDARRPGKYHHGH